jgi:cell division protease FtsH
MKLSRDFYVIIWFFVITIIGVVLLQDLVVVSKVTKTIPYSEFEQLLDAGQVSDLVVGPNEITGALRDAAPNEPQRFLTYRVPGDIAHRLTQAKQTFSGEPSSGAVASALAWLLPMLGFLAIWMFIGRSMGGGQGIGGMMAVGKSKARIYAEKDTKTTFADVAGVDEAKAELKEVVDFLRDPAGHSRLGARMPKGVLLVGPPGTGKTLLARAVAGEAVVPFFSISGSEFVEMFVGVGAARVRDLFEQARETAPAIVFIDELDALGRARGSILPGGGGHDEKEQTLNQLLSELDGFDPASGVVLLAATNRPEILDPALLRAGRFDRQVLVDRPDRKGRVDILLVHLKKIQLGPQVSADTIAALTPGFSGADLANLVNEAALLATRRDGENVTLDDFTQAIERIVAGLEKRNRILNPHEREVVAHHEMGHALVAMALPGIDSVQKLSIIPRGIAALGYTMQRPLEDRFLMDRTELRNRMTVLLGGRAAETLVFDEISTGAGDDLAKATEIARSMVVRFGMDPDLGQVAYEPEAGQLLDVPMHHDWQPRRYGEATACAIDAAVRALINDAYHRALAILTDNRGLLGRSATTLLAKETFSAADLKEIGAGLVLPVPQTAAPRAEPSLAAASSVKASAH